VDATDNKPNAGETRERGRAGQSRKHALGKLCVYSHNGHTSHWGFGGDVSFRVTPYLLAAALPHVMAHAAPAQTMLPEIEVRADHTKRASKTRHRQAPVTHVQNQTANAQPPPPALIVSRTTAGPVIGYQALTAVTGTKTATPIEQIPQTVIVLPRSVIDDQKPISQNDLLHNISDVAGMQDNAPYGNYYKVRGFLAERYVDGLPNYNDSGNFTSTVNTERVEVLKGPGSLFYQGGLGVIGGVINYVSKLPVATPQYQAGLNAGSFDLYNPWFDVNQPIKGDGSALFRMTGEYAQSRDYIDVLRPQRFSLNPTLTFDNRDGTTLTVQGSVSQLKQQLYPGLPGVGTVDTSVFSIRPNLYFGNPDVPPSASQYAGLTVRLDRELNDVWSFNVASRYESSQLNAQAQAFFSNDVNAFPNTPPSSFAAFNFHLFDGSTDYSITPNLIGKFSIGPIQSTVLFGADYDRIAANVSAWNCCGIGTSVDLSQAQPSFPAYIDPVAGGALEFDDREHITNAGLIAQLQSTVFERLHLLAGVREAYVDNQFNNLCSLVSCTFGAGNSYEGRKIKPLPRLGVDYDLMRGITMFAAYAEGLRGERSFISTSVPKPEQSDQIEGGLKLNLVSNLAGTLAVFDMTYSNVATALPNSIEQTQVGEERSKGFDADLTWQPVAGLSVLANYAYVDATVIKDNAGTFPIGGRVDFVPQNSGRLWAKYKVQNGLLQGFSVGAGLYSASRQTIDLTNQFWTPGYTIFDGTIAYETRNWTLALTGRNLADHHYFVPYYYFTLGRVAPGTPLTILASLTVKS
jgi:iron complex outermembrane receptor protein